MKSLVLSMVLAAAATPALSAELLGVRRVAYGSETDVIHVGGPKTYAWVRICAHKAPIEFTDFDVVFGNGGRQDIAVRRVIPKGQCTRRVNLNGPRRIIDRIVLRYDAIGNSGPRAVVSARGG